MDPTQHGAAGTASSVPAVAVVPPEAQVELGRIGTRWAQFPLDLAQGRMPPARAAIAALATRCGRDVPADLGPSVIVDQLRVLVLDAYHAGCGGGIPEELANLRRALG